MRGANSALHLLERSWLAHQSRELSQRQIGPRDQRISIMRFLSIGLDRVLRVLVSQAARFARAPVVLCLLLLLLLAIMVGYMADCSGGASTA